MNLAIDIVLEILSRLTVRSLIRFKCVCKTWYALIQSPNFVDMHLTLQLTKDDRHIQTLRCIHPFAPWARRFMLTRFDSLESLSLLTPPDVEVPGYDNEYSSYVLFGNHLNGIVCMFTIHDAEITLWNPALREFRMLPPRPFHCPCKFSCSNAIAIGFGFDDVTNDYKVVCVERYSKDDPPYDQFNVVQVYNLKSNSWRILEGMGECVPDELNEPGHPIFFKGSIHWLVWGGRGLRFILTFNITTELFGDIQFPHVCGQDYPYGSGLSRLFVSDDESTLSFVMDLSDLSPNQQLDVWTMKDNNSWTKKYSIDRSNIARILCSWENDKLLCINIGRALICCDIRTGEEHHIRQYYVDHMELGTLNVVVCIETLVSVMAVLRLER